MPRLNEEIEEAAASLLLRCPAYGSAGKFKVSFHSARKTGTVKLQGNRLVEVMVTGGEIAPIGPHPMTWQHAQTKDVLFGGDSGPRDERGGQLPYTLVDQAPRILDGETKELELCPCELRWLEMPPGKVYSGHWSFSVEEVS